MSAKPRRSRRSAAKRQPKPDYLKVFGDPPEGSTLEAIANEDRTQAAEGPRLTDREVLRPIIVNSLLARGMPADIKGEWLDILIDHAEILTRHVIILNGTKHDSAPQDRPNELLIAFICVRFEAHQRRLYGAVHEGADTSPESVIKDAFIATATEAGPGISVENVKAAVRYGYRVAAHSPAAAAAFAAMRSLVVDFEAAKSPVGAWLTARDRRIALEAIDDKFFVDYAQRRHCRPQHLMPSEAHQIDYDIAIKRINTEIRALAVKQALLPPTAPRRGRRKGQTSGKL